MSRIIVYSLVAIVFLSGCTAKLTEPTMNFEPPAYVEQMPALEEDKDFVSTGSIFGQGENPLFSDHKAMHINDIVTVEISEMASSSNSAKKNMAETDTNALGGGTFAATGGNSAVSSYADKLNGLGNIGFSTNTTATYSGQGSTQKDAQFTTTISARIVKVLQNGNYFISGRREMMIDDEKQIIQISGVIRPYDIDQNNKIYSAQMSEAKILYSSEGDIDQATKQGWGTKMVKAVWPF